MKKLPHTVPRAPARAAADPRRCARRTQESSWKARRRGPSGHSRRLERSLLECQQRCPMSLSADSLYVARRARRLAHWPAALCVVLWGCDTGQTGDSCGSDADCSSDSCSFGSCDPSLIELLAWLFETDPPPPSAPPAPWSAPSPRAAPPPPCVAESAGQCLATPGCRWFALCMFGRSDAPDAGVIECARAYAQTGVCPSPCELFTSCWR